MPSWSRKGFWCAWLALSGCGGLISCGQHDPSSSVGQVGESIIGGELDTTDHGVVSLLKQAGGGFYPACSGTLIAPNLVLTAHHCVAALNSADGQSVKCGTTQFGDLDRASSMLVSIEANVGREGLDPYRVVNVWVPDGSSDVCGRDIALLLLSGSGVPADKATPIEPELDQELSPNEKFSAIGYGLQDPSDQNAATAGHRMFVSTASVFCDGSACGTDMVKDGEFIADSPVCSGDSGGPALDQKGRVSGVTSRGDEKCTVGIYTSVSAWSDFITQKALSAAQSGGYAPPGWATGTPGPNPGTGGVGGVTGSGGAPNNAGTMNGGALASGGIVSAAGTTSSPTIDPLGISCTGNCPGAYACWTETGQPPGICVPKCSAMATTCPTDYTCNENLNACLPNSALQTNTVHASSSCSVSAPIGSNDGRGAWLGAALLLGAFGAGRARRRAVGRP